MKIRNHFTANRLIISVTGKKEEKGGFFAPSDYTNGAEIMAPSKRGRRTNTAVSVTFSTFDE
jgi:hypothetical protein